MPLPVKGIGLCVIRGCMQIISHMRSTYNCIKKLEALVIIPKLLDLIFFMSAFSFKNRPGLCVTYFPNRVFTDKLTSLVTVCT